MTVSPDEISASSTPSTSPLKHCEIKLAQLITRQPAIALLSPQRQVRPSTGLHGFPAVDKRQEVALVRQSRRRRALSTPAMRRRRPWRQSGIVAEIASEGIWVLHERRARQDLENFPVV